jgi:hypothetical protein
MGFLMEKERYPAFVAELTYGAVNYHILYYN